MSDKNYYLMDMDVSASSIPSNRCLETSEDAIAIADEVKEGEYISLLNRNNLSKVLLYRRTNYKTDNLSIYKWDGKKEDVDWFKDHENDTVLFIENADQLRGLAVLVSQGYSFKDKVIKLLSDIKLDKKPWRPIGNYYTIENVDEEYFRVHLTDKDKVFSGTFDGNDHVIYGLNLAEDGDEEGQPFAGLFRCLIDATIKNLTLSDVSIGTRENDYSHSALFGYARRSKFINICVDGEIEGSNCSAIGGVAIDCSFNECLNRASITGYARNINDDINIGGLLQYVGLSSDVISKVQKNEPKMFVKCLQAGSIKIDAKDAGSVCCGQLFGTALYKKTGDSYGIQIDHCISYDGGVPSVINVDGSLTRTNFYGKVNGSDEPKNCISGINTKLDLLSGLLGKTNIKISVSVVWVTASTKIDALIIPGSVNTLHSDDYMNSFITDDVSKITDDDIISNLYPYYTFVKQSKI